MASAAVARGGGVLGIMLLVPLAGVAFFRVYENQLIETTEAELIGQSAAIAAAMAQRLEEIGGADLPLGPEVAKATVVPGSRSIYLRNPGGSWTPQLPELDLTRTTVLPGRGAPRPAAEPPLLEYLSAGQAVDRILQETQKKTLAGFRVLDFNGVIIAGREDIGLSLAHVEEIKERFRGIMPVRCASASSTIRSRSIPSAGEPAFAFLSRCRLS